MTKIKSINSLRFIFILLIFLHHLDAFNTYYVVQPSKVITDVLLELFIGVNFFFILSGFVCSLGYSDKIKDNQINLETFISKRINKLYPVYILSIVMSLILFRPAFPHIIQNIIPFILLLQSFVPIDFYAFNYNGAAWCISNLMFYYIVFYFTVKMHKKIYISIYIIIVCLILLGVIFLNNIGNTQWFFYINPIFRLSEFYLGMILYDLFKKYHLKFDNVKSSILQVLSLVVVVLSIYIAIKYPIDMRYRYTVYYMLPMALLIFSCSLPTGIISKILSNSILDYLGKISIYIYLFHQLILVKLASIYADRITDFRSVLPISLLGFIITLILSITVDYFINRRKILNRNK